MQTTKDNIKNISRQKYLLLAIRAALVTGEDQVLRKLVEEYEAM